MFSYKKTIGFLAIIGLAIISTASTMRGNKYKNLQVLPKDISEKQLDSLMNSYNKALKVSCDFCHTKAKKNPLSLLPSTDELDYALDMPMKEEARKMIRMQIQINTNYFYYDSSKAPAFLNVVTCNTCHRGNPFPAYE